MKRKTDRKPKQARNRTLARKRQKQLQQARSRSRRARFYRRRKMINTAKSRKKAVMFYRTLSRRRRGAHRTQGESIHERDAVQQTALKWQVSCSTIRRWDQLDRKGGWRALLDQSKRPNTIHYQIHVEFKLLIVVIRTLLGWGSPREIRKRVYFYYKPSFPISRGERRISAELERREMATISHTSVNRIFHRYHLPTKARHLKGKSDGLKRRRYRRPVANELWHLDFVGPISLLNGCKIWLLVVIDDFSRFCLGVHVCKSACADAVITALQADFSRYGKPQEILTDNALAFTSAWQDSVGKLDAFFDQEEVDHKLISAYYPLVHGKAEAFIKIVSTECLQMKEFANFQELETFVACSFTSFRTTYYNQRKLPSS